MKKVITLSLAIIATAATVSADIQAPPGNQYNSSRKLGRAISNILYGFTEIPKSITQVIKRDGGNAGWSHGLVLGTTKTYKRLGYGIYELFTFRCPTYKGTFKPPYENCGTDGRIEMDPTLGFSEFPTELDSNNTFYTSTGN